MTTVSIGCETARTLFYEPHGLLLRSCLIPINGQHSQHLLTFQLGYLGIGEITVHIGLETTEHGSGIVPDETYLTTAVLSGVDVLDDVEEISRHQVPSVELSYVAVPNRKISYRYTVWGQPASPEDDLRGELSTVLIGEPPTLKATTRAGATRKAIPMSSLPTAIAGYREPCQ